MEGSKSFTKPPTFKGKMKINSEDVTLDAIKPEELKSALNGEAVKKGSPRTKICLVDCQSSKQNTGKELRGALHMDIIGAAYAQIKFDAIVAKVPSTFDKLAAADMVVFYCSYAQARSPTTMHAYQKAMKAKPRAGSNPNQLVALLGGGIHAYMELKDAPGVKDYTEPEMAKVLSWANGDKIEVTGPSFQQVPKPGTVPQEPVPVLYTEE